MRTRLPRRRSPTNAQLVVLDDCPPGWYRTPGGDSIHWDGRAWVVLAGLPRRRRRTLGGWLLRWEAHLLLLLVAVLTMLLDLGVSHWG